ncbi:MULTISPECIES: type 1 glutamine amidotransferase domain-containing protein [Rhodomicrobium]|uniref:type 1 glutamine amidotransferase domain-containing protein n=1 Tax=Rhodomicrobium TaxID=1068 RepID=UPI000B4BC98A|nr:MULTISPECIES: type 1 glutamine amidotransferase domain-containing protein [Rhodomicrobium]
MQKLMGKRIAILATHGFEQSELETPLKTLRELGAEVHVVSPESGAIKGWQDHDWGRPVPVDRTLGEVQEANYDALVLPGGQMNPDTLRLDPRAVALVKAFYDSGKTVAAICHAPWLLIEAGVIRGRRATSYASIKTDVINAGANWIDEAVVVDDGLVTSRKPADLPAFCDKIAEEILEGFHQRAAA